MVNALRRAMIVALIAITLYEAYLLILNWGNLEAPVKYYQPPLVAINSSTGYALVILVAHDAFAKVNIIIANPSNSTMAIHLSNGTTRVLNPGGLMKLAYIIRATSIYPAYCRGLIYLVNASPPLGYALGVGNVFYAGYTVFPLRAPPYSPFISQLEYLGHQVNGLRPCGEGVYVVLTTNSSRPIVVATSVEYEVFEV